MNVFQPREPATAAEWFAARHAGHDTELERRFAAWLAASRQHFEDYALCELTWELAASAAVGISQAPANVPWYRRTSSLAAAAAAAALLLFAFLRVMHPSSAPAVVWQTQAGEQRSISLADGSHIVMNTRSMLEIRMGARRREVRLLTGEAYFEVAHDESRPFIVRTPLGHIRAVGTRFDVLLDGQRVEVAMEEGKVMVRSALPDAPEVLTVAGMSATLAPGSAAPHLQPADLNRIENWRARRIEFDRVPLGTALREFSRYTPVPITAGSPEIAQMPISAVLKAGDVAALRATLKGAFGLQVIESGDGLVVMDRPH
ncbi:MAG TPA: FecR domain-containing protein [Steroidobacteraceae bacterium]|nr:FecR domain-containing protein [Steroidobacteraceae bacterium]